MIYEKPRSEATNRRLCLRRRPPTIQGMATATRDTPPPAADRAPAGALTRFGLIALMVVGSVTLWIGSPMFWLWLTSYLQSGTQASMGPYGALLAGIIATSVLLAKGLAALQRAYARATGKPTVRIILPWRRSLRGGRDGSRETDGRLPVSVLDVVMVLSVVIAALALVVWFLIVEPTPPGVGPGPAKD
jgi:hypothetical protein